VLTVLQGTATHAVGSLTASQANLVDDMSTFSVPRNAPSFSNPQRELENRVWGASGMTARPSGNYAHNGGGIGGVQNRIGGLFEKNRDLPMYKDKPFSYAKTRRSRPFWKRKRIFAIAGLCIVSILYFLGFIGSSDTSLKAKDSWNPLQRPERPGKVNWLSRRERVVEAFKLSWDAYERYAWGMFSLSML
jgi:endoplasmic reticulum Man9GlcNAc2 1,2-alpha-mannosidase